MLCIIILLLVFLRESRCAHTVFFGHTESDKIIYTSIIIPRYAVSVELNIFISDPLQKSTPYALLKYNGVPSIDDYDQKIPLSAQKNLQLRDSNPSEAQLFVGIWGGVLLHSYRYFAGSATVIYVGVEARVRSCSNDLMRDQDCSRVIDTLGSATVVPAPFSLPLPPNSTIPTPSPPPL